MQYDWDLLVVIFQTFPEFSPSYLLNFATRISSMHMTKVVVVVVIVADDVVVDI